MFVRSKVSIFWHKQLKNLILGVHFGDYPPTRHHKNLLSFIFSLYLSTLKMCFVLIKIVFNLIFGESIWVEPLTWSPTFKRALAFTDVPQPIKV